MSDFLEKWYGDGCPFWTWPATILSVAGLALTAITIVNLVALADCEKRGGNTMKDNVCYHVTMRKID